MSSRKQKLEASLEGLFSGPKARPASKVEIPISPEKPKPLPEEAKPKEKPAPISDAPVPESIIAAPEPVKPATVTRAASKPSKISEKLPAGAEAPSTIGTTERPMPVVVKPKTVEVPIKPAREVIPASEEPRPITEEPRAVISTDAIGEGLQIVTFRLNKNFYGVDIAAVQTIIKPQPVCSVPFTAPYIEGLTNLRGQIVPVIDLRKRLGLPGAETDKDTRIIVVSILNEWAGIRVDEVTGVTSLPSDAIEPASQVVSATEGSLLSGIARREKELILILDIPAVFAVSGKAYHRAAKNVLDNYD